MKNIRFRPYRRLMNGLIFAVVILCSGALIEPSAAAQQPEAEFFAGMRWRLVGPFRAGRVSSVVGVPDAGGLLPRHAAGALWKSTSGGTTWKPISGAIPVTGIGAVAVAPRTPTSFMWAPAGTCSATAFISRATRARRGSMPGSRIRSTSPRSSSTRATERRPRRCGFRRQLRHDGLLQQ